MWWTIMSASRGSSRFPVVSIFLFVIHLCKQWKAERVTMKAITRLLFCPLKIVSLLRSLPKLWAVLERAWEGDSPSSLNAMGQVQSHSRACKPLLRCKLLLPGSNMFLMSSRGVGGEAGFTVVHPGLPKGGSDLSSSQAEVTFMSASGDCWTGLFLGCDILFLLPVPRCEEAAGVRLGPSSLHSRNGRLRLWKQVKSWALGSPYWPS